MLPASLLHHAHSLLLTTLQMNLSVDAEPNFNPRRYTGLFTLVALVSSISFALSFYLLSSQFVTALAAVITLTPLTFIVDMDCMHALRKDEKDEPALTIFHIIFINNFVNALTAAAIVGAARAVVENPQQWEVGVQSDEHKSEFTFIFILFLRILAATLFSVRFTVPKLKQIPSHITGIILMSSSILLLIVHITSIRKLTVMQIFSGNIPNIYVQEYPRKEYIPEHIAMVALKITVAVLAIACLILTVAGSYFYRVSLVSMVSPMPIITCIFLLLTICAVDYIRDYIDYKLCILSAVCFGTICVTLITAAVFVYFTEFDEAAFEAYFDCASIAFSF
ncbi:hypothetical protein PMAYCL1PPCAC_10868 [Pristionchus mayeri]|uniref:G protein-coupled receptor n=1 Tax=Pristionchus mayeri TaxID=1317129 RepID=A0AAN4ZGC6_9BILA|nr:hypothetical protein PMAYCL1PPCAC_10867 [Pristionchus mayeri]GMR40673.1 hypothetical protein PMAYCL1PPCAC_10868 [Pristionchus mayeri]